MDHLDNAPVPYTFLIKKMTHMKYVLKATLDNITERAAKNAGIDVQMSLFFYLCIIIIIWNLSISLYTAKIRRLLSSEKVDTGHIDALIGGDKSFLFDSLCVSVFLFMAAFMSAS